MKNKKKQGERFRSLFDELDMRIINILFKGSQGVLSLTKKLNVEHKTAKKHIDKLESYGFILIEHEPQNKKLLKLTTLTRGFLLKYKVQIGVLNERKSFEELMTAVFNESYGKINIKKLSEEVTEKFLKENERSN